jgi:uncharacterized protein (TIGR03067 family)
VISIPGDECPDLVMRCRMRLCLPLLLLFSGAAVADEPKVEAKQKAFSPEAKKELKKLEGKWKLIKLAIRGEEAEFPLDSRITFKDTQMTVFIEDSVKTTAKSRIVALDPNTDPTCLDLIEMRPGMVDLESECVYKLDGDTLRLAISLPTAGKSRPPGFDKSIDTAMIWTLKRVKE